jgi:hypothetical protein
MLNPTYEEAVANVRTKPIFSAVTTAVGHQSGEFNLKRDSGYRNKFNRQSEAIPPLVILHSSIVIPRVSRTLKNNLR